MHDTAVKDLIVILSFGNVHEYLTIIHFDNSHYCSTDRHPLYQCFPCEAGSSSVPVDVPMIAPFLQTAEL